MIKLENILNEALPALVPEYPVNIAGHSLTLRFDTNVNKTKKGVKLQFVLKDVPQDPRDLQTLANEIGAELQEKFGSKRMQIVYDVENPYRNVVGFLLPLPSISNYIMKSVMGADMDQAEVPEVGQEDTPEQIPQEPQGEELPDTEQPPAEEPLKERMKKIAGL
jgi:hypothetical protein